MNKKEYTLYWKDTPLGTVICTGSDFPWMHGTFKPENTPVLFTDLFRFMTSEENFDRDLPFDLELLDDENWTLKSDDGEEVAICIPAVHLDDAEIAWRMR
jgi:hypothetical protein